MEKVLFKSEERKSAAEAAAMLRHIADRVESGEIVLSRGEEQVRLKIPAGITLELKVEEETKTGRSGVKKSLEIELEWMDGEGYDGAAAGEGVSIS